jgi:hypothetical protein
MFQTLSHRHVLYMHLRFTDYFPIQANSYIWIHIVCQICNMKCVVNF